MLEAAVRVIVGVSMVFVLADGSVQVLAALEFYSDFVCAVQVDVAVI